MSFRSRTVQTSLKWNILLKGLTPYCHMGHLKIWNILWKNLHSTSYWKTVTVLRMCGKRPLLYKRGPQILPNGYSVAPHISREGSRQHTPLCLTLPDCKVDIIPHSNAEEERVFSMVQKNKTAFRPSLDPKGTQSSILTMKLANT